MFMKTKLLLLFTMISVSGFAQTKLGDVRFNDIDVFGDTELMLNGAGLKNKEYAAALYLNSELDGSDNGVSVANRDADMAVTLKISVDKTNDELKDMLRIGLERATDGNSYVLEDQIRDFLEFLPKEIRKFDIYKILYKKDSQEVVLFKNRTRLGSVKGSLDFKKALFKIWLGGNPVSEELKEGLLGSTEVNPVLGSWKTLDKDTGVAISIMQLYIIKNRLFGVIQEMLRKSERDAVCYKCQGEDRNQKVQGLVVLKDLKPKGDNKYVDGEFTDINTGEVSTCQVWVNDKDPDILNVKYRGSGGRLEWKRVADKSPTNRQEYKTVKRF